LEDLGGGCPAEDFARPVVDLGDELVELCLNEILEAGALLVKFLNLDPVINDQMSVMCGQGSATPLGVI